MAIPNCILTKKGAALLAKTPDGTSIPVTKWQIGTGALPLEENMADRTELVRPLKDIPIASVSSSGRQCLVLGQFINEGMEAFTWEELGLFAQDPEEGEILYAVGNAGGSGAAIEGWAEKVREFVFGMELAFSGTANVTAEISKPLIFATLEDLERAIFQHNNDPDAHPLLKAGLEDLDARLTVLELKYGTNVTNNSFTVTFASLDGVDVEGVWNAPQKRIEF